MEQGKKAIEINKEVNDVLERYFEGEISSITTTKLDKHYKADEIDTKMFKFLKKLKLEYNKIEAGKSKYYIRYKLKEEIKKEEKKLIINDKLNKVIKDHFDNDVNNINSGELDELFKSKEITKSEKNTLKKIKLVFKKGKFKELVEYDITEEEEEAVEEEVIPKEEEEEPKEEVEVEEEEVIPKEESKEETEPEPEKQEEVEEEEVEEVEEVIPIKPIKKSKYVSQHRKAFVDWVNKGFYKQILRESKDIKLNVYQLLIKNYLAIDTPYRGVLVYHGLGTGKTATAISLAESLSKDMSLTTMLPASLKGNFVGEIKRWDRELNVEESKWKFHSNKEIEDNGTLRKAIFGKYNLPLKIINLITNQTKQEVIKDIKVKLADKEYTKEELGKQVKKELQKVMKKISACKGFWVQDKNGQDYSELDDFQKIYLSCQNHQVALVKYNFIHYNPLPTISKEDEIDDSDEDEDLLEDDTEKKGHAALRERLMKKLAYNKRTYNVDSPFYNECIIIDEVHNFVRSILNKRSSSIKFYEWIVNAKNVKLVFLSGTPIINKPCEIAILFNMLKGKIDIVRFTIKSNDDSVEVTNKLNEIFYENESSIELFHVENRGGKLVIAFTKNAENFSSVMNPDNEVVYTSSNGKHEYSDFIDDIYDGLNKLYDEGDILPSKKDALAANLDEENVFDTDTNIVYNRSQKLFEITNLDSKIDLSINEEFMDYFFMDSYDIESKKQTLLRRMLMGFTSYYPIDRASIASMPSIVKPESSFIYGDYTISENINIVACPMSNMQFNKYAEAWRAEKKKALMQQMRRHLHQDVPFDYHIRTRQICNMNYKDDEFRYIKDDDRKYSLKQKVYDELLESKALTLKNDLKEYSPKIYNIMLNIQKFMDGKKPTGKILIYSEFRGDAGAEALELVLRSHGYEPFNYKDHKKTKSLKYTIISGEEGDEERANNKDIFNETENKYGEYIQIMIISGAGAEGISLECVRQVHILEPYWNFVRINQVFGRAIRLESHKDLDPKDRNVEEYLYLSILPPGENIEEIYESIKGWSDVPKIKTSDLKIELAKASNKSLKDLIDNVVKIGVSVDSTIVDIMERKNKVSTKIIDIVKESSLDCIQHTRDDPQLNNRCIRFSNKLLHEIAYFPGISSNDLFNIDRKQLHATFQVFIKPNHYVISGDKDGEYSYYEVKDVGSGEKVDVRYLRENAKKICDVSLASNKVYAYAPKDHSISESLGNRFSVYQDIYSLEKFYEKINTDKKFPPIETLLSSEIIAYKIKYNITEMMFYSPNEENKLRRLYKFNEYLENKVTKALIVCQGSGSESAVYIEH